MRKDTDNCLLLILLISGRAVRSTIFDRDRTGEAQEPESRIKRIDDQIADLRRGIEQDIRAALLNLKSTADQVPVEQQGQDLSERELKLAQDRFRSGVTNNIEVTTSKDELARAPGETTFSQSRVTGLRSMRWHNAAGATENKHRSVLGNP